VLEAQKDVPQEALSVFALQAQAESERQALL
jgi:hypothetical protein